MNRSGRFLAAALVVGLSYSALAAQDAKDKGDAATPKGKKDDKILTKDKLLTAGTLSGTLAKLDEDKKFSLSVTYYDIDAGKVQANQQHYVNRINQINQLRNLVEAQRQLAQLQAEMIQRNQNIYQKVTKDVELQAEDKVKVRSLKPLVTYDDKGEVVQYSKEDLKKLAADGPKLPGVGPTYPASYDKLKEQQKLIVFLAKPKTPTPPPAKKGADAPAGELFQSRPRVVAIVIAEEVAPPK
jgi:hypothetical protein